MAAVDCALFATRGGAAGVDFGLGGVGVAGNVGSGSEESPLRPPSQVLRLGGGGGGTTPAMGGGAAPWG